MPILTIFIKHGVGSPTTVIRQKKEKKERKEIGGIQTQKEEVKPLLYADDIKKNEILPFATQMDHLEGVLLSKVNKTITICFYLHV